MRILIYRLGSLGDTVLALPCFHLVRATHPQAEIVVLTNSPVSGQAAPLESILGSSGLIDGVIHYPVGLRDPSGILALVRRIRAGKFDLLVSLAAARGFGASVRDALFFRACGIPKEIGIPFRYRNLVCRRRGELFESEAERLAQRVAPLGKIDITERRWFDLRLTVAEKAEAARLLAPLGKNFLAASIGTKSPLNDWGMENWTQLLGGLNAPDRGLVLLGSAGDSDRSGKLLENWSGPGLNLCGTTSPRISAAILEQARLHLGHDSGPMHLAAAAGTRCVTVFSARCPPGQWFPVGDGHRNFYPYSFYRPRRTNDLEHQLRALASIRPDEVRAAAEKILG